MPIQTWHRCVDCLQDELPSQQFNTWIKPLQVSEENGAVVLLAPNRFIKDFVQDKFYSRITELMQELSSSEIASLSLGVVGASSMSAAPRQVSVQAPTTDFYRGTTSFQGDLSTPNAIEADFSPTVSTGVSQSTVPHDVSPGLSGLAMDETPLNGNHRGRRAPVKTAAADSEDSLIKPYTFDSFVEGKSNQLAMAASLQVAENPGGSYNPLFLYGGVGLGKTHLMHAVGNALKQQNPDAKIVYLHSERFVQDMVKALQLKAIGDFKRYYRSVDALLIDDIQFFARKDRSQEEFFHTFNALLEGGQQMILTCDRYPKEIDGLEERLKSRFGWGLTVAIEPPDLETRVAILMKKAEESQVDLPNEEAFFIAQRIRSNVRELEGALKRVIAHAKFIGEGIDIPLIKDSLKDLLALQDKQVGLDNIQRTVAEYYKIKVADLMSRRRSRSVARPRQVAMALAKELTNHSLPEIGDSFGGRDHTTVLHACRKIKELRDTSSDIREDYKNLLRSLTT